MAHFARLDQNNTVTMVTVVSNEDMIDDNGVEQEALGAAVCEQVVGPGPWIQTSYNGNFRGRYAGIGDRYDATLDVFISPRPYPSWVLDDNADWQAPTPKPENTDTYAFEWNESTVSWVQVPAD